MTNEAIADILAENRQLKGDVLALKDVVADLQGQLDWFRRQVFGTKSERVIPTSDAQCTLPLGDAPSTPPARKTQTVTYTRTCPDANKTPHGREEIPAHIPRVDIPVEPDFDTTGMEKVAEKITEQLEYKPPEFYANRYIRPVFATIINGERTLRGAWIMQGEGSRNH
ncbi:MAG: transposase [Chitinispirillaceae bacterium]|nr:transposase [Chitinispirillaceae bacterium]